MDENHPGYEWKRSFVDFPKFSFDPAITDLVNHELTKSNRSPDIFHGTPAHVLDNYPGHLLDWVIRPHSPLSASEYRKDVHNSTPEVNSKRPIWKPPDPLSAEDLITKLVQEHGWRLNDFKALVDRLEDVYESKLSKRETTPTPHTKERLIKSDISGMESTSGPNYNTLLGTQLGYSPLQDKYYKYHNKNLYQPEQKHLSIENICTNGGLNSQSDNDDAAPIHLVGKRSKDNVSFFDEKNNVVTRKKTRYRERTSHFIQGPSANSEALKCDQKETRPSENSLNDQTTSGYNPLLKNNEIKATNDFENVYGDESKESYPIANTYYPTQSRRFHAKVSSEYNLSQQNLEKDKQVTLTDNITEHEQGTLKSPTDTELNTVTFNTKSEEPLNVHERKTMAKGKVESSEFYKLSIHEESDKPIEFNKVPPSILDRGKSGSYPHKSNFERMVEAIHSHALSCYDMSLNPKDYMSTNIFTKNTVGMVSKESERNILYQDQLEPENNQKSYLEESYTAQSETAVTADVYTSKENDKDLQPDNIKPDKLDSKTVEEWKSSVRLALFGSITRRERRNANIQSEEMPKIKCDEVRKDSCLQSSLYTAASSIFDLKPPPEKVKDEFYTATADLYIEESDKTSSFTDSMESSISGPDENRNETIQTEVPDTSTNEAMELDENTVIKEVTADDLDELNTRNPHIRSEDNDSNSQPNSLSTPININNNNFHNSDDSNNIENSFISRFDDLHSKPFMEETEDLFTEKNTETIGILDDIKEYETYNSPINSEFSDKESNSECISNKPDSTTFLSDNQLNENTVGEMQFPNDEKDLMESQGLDYDINNSNDSQTTHLESFKFCTELYEEEKLSIPVDNENREELITNNNNKVKIEEDVNVSHLTKWPLKSSQSQLNQQMDPEKLWHALKIRRLQERHEQKNKMKSRSFQGVAKRTVKGRYNKFSCRHPVNDYRSHGNLWQNQRTTLKRRKWGLQDKELFHNNIRTERTSKETRYFHTPMSAEKANTGIRYPQGATTDQKSKSLTLERAHSLSHEINSVSAKEEVNEMKVDNKSNQCCIM